MTILVGYSDPGDGYCVHDDSGITWGEHPDYEGSIIFLQDEDTNMVTAVGRKATDRQRERLQNEPIAWHGPVPYGEAIVTAEDAMEAVVMLHEGP
jgi:hypothetical protein